MLSDAAMHANSITNLYQSSSGLWAQAHTHQGQIYILKDAKAS